MGNTCAVIFGVVVGLGGVGDWVLVVMVAVVPSDDSSAKRCPVMLGGTQWRRW